MELNKKLALYKAVDGILNMGGDTSEVFSIFLDLCDTEEEKVLATQYYDRNVRMTPAKIKEIASTPFHTYKDPFEEDDRNDVWQDTEDQLSFDNLPADYWQKLYANHPVRRETQKDRDEDTYTGRRPSFFADHDSDEYQEALEAKWDREDREVERKREQGL